MLEIFSPERSFFCDEDTITSFSDILEGKVDDLPENAFFMAGTPVDVKKKAAELK